MLLLGELVQCHEKSTKSLCLKLSSVCLNNYTRFKNLKFFFFTDHIGCIPIYKNPNFFSIRKQRRSKICSLMKVLHILNYSRTQKVLGLCTLSFNEIVTLTQPLNDEERFKFKTCYTSCAEVECDLKKDKTNTIIIYFIIETNNFSLRIHL